MGYSIVYETNDSGVSWSIANEVTNIGLQKFHAPKNYIGYSSGYKGLIYKYFDTSYVPVELIHFSGFSEDGKVILYWKTATEINNQGFYIERSIDDLNWQTIGFIKGSNNNTEITNYSFVDNEISSEKYYYRLKQLDYNGMYDYSNTIEVSISINTFYLFQNYPNPFNPVTTIKYAIKERGMITLTVYDILGREITTLVNEVKDAGYYTVQFDGSRLASGVQYASGVYIYTIRATGIETGSSSKFIKSNKMLLIK
jgi:hypothetical protein